METQELKVQKLKKKLSVEGFNSRFEQVEESMNKLGNMPIEIMQYEKQRENKDKK